MELLRLFLYLQVYAVFVFKARVSSLRLVELKVPEHSVRGASARLECRYELAPGESLYSVKWYKDGDEFYRYVPKDLPPTQVFTLPGVQIDATNSTDASILLEPIGVRSSGRYRCEVSGEAPLFPTVSDHGDMDVVSLPVNGPTIVGSRSRYRVGERLRVNCTSGASRPAASLTWFVNGEPAPRDLLRGPWLAASLAPDDDVAATLGLEFRLRAKHFRKGALKLKCLATIASVYWKTNEESVLGERPHKSHAKPRDAAGSSRADRVQASSVGGASSAPRSATLAAPLLALLGLVIF